MKSLKLNSFKHCNHRAAIRLALLFAALTVCHSASAQSLQPRPVARLVSSPSAAAGHSRPRRAIPVIPEEKPAPPVEVNATPKASPVAYDTSTIERRAFEQTNQARVENGLTPLLWDAELLRMARAHSERMALAGFFSHETPEGQHLKERARSNGLHFRVIGENIAYNKGYDDPGGFAVERWMISSGHRANILYRGFQASAIGSYVSADGSTYLTQIFIAR
ncbi:MAG TPA: CAP domain-containing protein [Pyrinomonadaceae bacterium]|jgi:uncharacterized protein YkwD